MCDEIKEGVTYGTRNTRGGREKLYKTSQLKSLNVDGKILLNGS